MNHIGEIAWLASLALPTVALVNNAQREHQEFMAGAQATAVENGAAISALNDDGIAIFPGDDDHTGIWRGLAAGRRTIEFGLTPLQTVHAGADARPARFTATIDGRSVELRLNIAGRHNVRNALAAAACAHAIGVPLEAIAQGLQAFQPVSGRLRRMRGVAGFGLIDDSYNANPDSVLAAIDVLADEPAPRLLVLGDMGEVGTQGAQFHREVGGYARERGIERLLTAGELGRETAGAFGPDARHFESVESLMEAAGPVAATSASVLVKGSRFMRMERVVTLLCATGGADGANSAAGGHH